MVSKNDCQQFPPISNIEVDIGEGTYFKNDDDCKDEPFDNDSIGQCDVDDNLIDDIKKEPSDNDIKYDFNVIVNPEVKDEKIDRTPEEIGDKKKYHRKKVFYNIISGSELLKRNYRYYSKKSIASKDLKKIDDVVRSSWSYRNSKYKCQSCPKGFRENDALQKHLENKHSEV